MKKLATIAVILVALGYTTTALSINLSKAKELSEAIYINTRGLQSSAVLYSNAESIGNNSASIEIQSPLEDAATYRCTEEKDAIKCNEWHYMLPPTNSRNNEPKDGQVIHLGYIPEKYVAISMAMKRFDVNINQLIAVKKPNGYFITARFNGNMSKVTYCK